MICIISRLAWYLSSNIFHITYLSRSFSLSLFFKCTSFRIPYHLPEASVIVYRRNYGHASSTRTTSRWNTIRTREHSRHVYDSFSPMLGVVTLRAAFPAETCRRAARLSGATPALHDTTRCFAPARSICHLKCLFYRISIGYTDALHRRRWRRIKAAEISASVWIRNSTARCTSSTLLY